MSAQEGLFQRARGGTIFLDEIGDLPLDLQVKLLRVIETKEILPVGTTTPIKVDVRVIAATNRDLRKRVEAGAVPRGSLLPPERRRTSRSRPCASGARTFPGSSST